MASADLRKASRLSGCLGYPVLHNHSRLWNRTPVDTRAYLYCYVFVFFDLALYLRSLGKTHYFFSMHHRWWYIKQEWLVQSHSVKCKFPDAGKKYTFVSTQLHLVEYRPSDHICQDNFESRVFAFRVFANPFQHCVTYKFDKPAFHHTGHL